MTEPVTPVKTISTWLPVSDEDIVDFGIGSEADQAAAAARIDRERRKSDRLWRALPARVRLIRTLRYHRWRAEERARSWLHTRLFPECER